MALVARPLRALRAFPALARSAPMSTAATDVSVDKVDGVAVIRLDAKGEKMNTLTERLMQEFDGILGDLEKDTAVKAAVLISAKADNFIAGADIKMLAACKTADEATQLATAGQRIMDRIDRSRFPVVAAINGPAMGGGLEVALACHYRIATSSPKTQLSVPEVMLGLLPGAGGTQRLPRLVGMQAALDMMLTGKNIKPDKAKRMGLVNVVVDPNALERAAITAAGQLARGELKRATRKPRTWTEWLLEGTAPGRQMLFNMAEKATLKQTKGKYPAPPRILEVAKTGLAEGMVKGLQVEAKAFGELTMTDESKALRGIFFGQTACKKNPYGKPVHPVRSVGVLGAGLMGAGIAQVTAVKDIKVFLKDSQAAGLARGEGQIAASLAKRVKKKQLTPFIRDKHLANVVGLTDEDTTWPTFFKSANLVVEAVPEELTIKHKVVAQMEEVLSPDAIIASNTSTLPLAHIAKHAKRPGQIVGMHYFSPVEQMPLLEVIPHNTTSKDTCAAAVDLGIRQGKTVIVVRDVPGFYVNRCLGPMIAEAMAIVQSGTDPLVLNEAMKGFGFPVGPITLADEVGIDVTNHGACDRRTPRPGSRWVLARNPLLLPVPPPLPSGAQPPG